MQGQVLGPYEDSLMEDRGHFPGMRIMLFWAQARTSDKIMFEALLALQAPERKILLFFGNGGKLGTLGGFGDIREGLRENPISNMNYTP